MVVITNGTNEWEFTCAQWAYIDETPPAGWTVVSNTCSIYSAQFFAPFASFDFGSGDGTVKSVGLILPSSTFEVTGSPVTETGDLNGAFIEQVAKTFLAGPLTGADAVPTWRLIAFADFPQSGATSGQALTWNGTTWTPTTLPAGYTNEEAQDAVGGILLDSSEIDFTYDDATPSITAILKTTAVTAGTYGSATLIPIIVVDSKGRITGVTTAAITGLPSGTSGQTLRHNGTSWISNSFLYNDGAKIGVNTTSPAQTVDINGGLQLRFASMTPDAANGWLMLGGFSTLNAAGGGSMIGPLTGFNAAINRPIRTLIIQGASDGNGEGISFVTGGTPTERFNIGVGGSIRFNALSGTGNRFPVLDSSGIMTRGTVDPATLILGNGTANQVTYYTAAQTLSSGANFTFNGTNVGIGGIATPLHRLDINAGNINIRFNNAAAPTAGNEWLTLGSYNSLPTGQTATHIFASAASISGAPLGGLYFQGRSDNDTFSNLYFVTGATPSAKMIVTAAGVYFPAAFRTGTATLLAGWDSSGKSTDLGLSGLSIVAGVLTTTNNGTTTGTGSANKVAIWSSASALTFDTDLHYDATNKRLSVGTASATNNIQALNSTGGQLLRVEGSSVGNGAQATIIASNASGTAGALLEINNAGSGDPYVRFAVAAQSWAFGIDNSNSDTLCIAADSGIASAIWMIIHPTTGFFAIAGQTLKTGISLAIGGTGGIMLPYGTTAQRPAFQNGIIRGNNEIGGIEAINPKGTWNRITCVVAPTIGSYGTGAGTGASAVFSTASDAKGIIILTAGTTPAAAGNNIITINFGQVWSETPVIQVQGASNIASASIGWFISAYSGAAFTIQATTALAAGVTYSISFHVKD